MKHFIYPPTWGSTVYTGVIMPAQNSADHVQTYEDYMNDIKILAKRMQVYIPPKQKEFVWRGKPSALEPERAVIRDIDMPTMIYDKPVSKSPKVQRLLRYSAYQEYEVRAIAGAAYIKGMRDANKNNFVNDDLAVLDALNSVDETMIEWEGFRKQNQLNFK